MSNLRFPLKNAAFLMFIAVLSAAPVEAASTTSSMSRLIEGGQDVSCDFKKNDATGSQSGTIYVSQNKMRGDFNVSDPSSGTSLMHMIHEQGTSYMWGGSFGENQGMKMRIQGSAPNGGNRQGPDLEEEMEFECRPWPVDQSLFAVPSNVEFMELGSGMPDMGQLQCMACDQAPEGPERQQCLQALGCA